MWIGPRPANVRGDAGDADSSRGALLDPAGRGWSLRALQRPCLRGRARRVPAPATTRPLPRGARRRMRRRALHDRAGAVAGRRRGESWRGRHGCRREPPHRLVAPVSLRGPLLAGWHHPGSRRGRRRALQAHHQSARGPAAPRSRRDRPAARVGTRRARARRDVELQLDDRLADRRGRAVHGAASPATARPGPGLGCRSARRPRRRA
jgi:hypothetical protein